MRLFYEKKWLNSLSRQYKSGQRTALFFYFDKNVVGSYLKSLHLCEYKVNDAIEVGQTTITLTNEITFCGKTFSVNEHLEHDRNVSKKIDNLNKALLAWNKRSLSIFGRN
jgi:hypothetical protein